MEDVERNPPVNRILDRLQETIKGNICATISIASHKIDDREVRADAMMCDVRNLATETIEGTALALESVDNIKRGDSLALGVLGVGDGITNDTLKEGL